VPQEQGKVYPPLEGPITGFMWTCLRADLLP
jgi:hypothetical protein